MAMNNASFTNVPWYRKGFIGALTEPFRSAAGKARNPGQVVQDVPIPQQAGMAPVPAASAVNPAAVPDGSAPAAAGMGPYAGRRSNIFVGGAQWFPGMTAQPDDIPVDLMQTEIGPAKASVRYADNGSVAKAGGAQPGAGVAASGGVVNAAGGPKSTDAQTGGMVGGPKPLPPLYQQALDRTKRAEVGFRQRVERGRMMLGQAPTTNRADQVQLTPEETKAMRDNVTRLSLPVAERMAQQVGFRQQDDSARMAADRQSQENIARTAVEVENKKIEANQSEKDSKAAQFHMEQMDRLQTEIAKAQANNASDEELAGLRQQVEAHQGALGALGASGSKPAEGNAGGKKPGTDIESIVADKIDKPAFRKDGTPIPDGTEILGPNGITLVVRNGKYTRKERA